MRLELCYIFNVISYYTLNILYINALYLFINITAAAVEKIFPKKLSSCRSVGEHHCCGSGQILSEKTELLQEHGGTSLLR